MTQASDWPSWVEGWPKDLALARFSAEHHGDFVRWQAAVTDMPALVLGELNLN